MESEIQGWCFLRSWQLEHIVSQVEVDSVPGIHSIKVIGDNLVSSLENNREVRITSVPVGSEEEKKRGELTRQTRFNGEKEVEVFTGNIHSTLSADYMPSWVLSTRTMGGKISVAPGPSS